MYIEEIHLIAFGQFQDYRLNLHKDMTIIYGDNEAGKSTIWHFICGMFYGFYRPNIKTRRYLPEHERFRPWIGNSYKGSLLLYDDSMKRHVRIYRDFMPGQESVEVLDEQTGETITALYDTHPIYRCPDVAKKHLGMSYGSFMNTYGIMQLGQATDTVLMEEVKQLLIAGMTGHKEAVSLQGVKEEIQDKLQAIGTKRRSQSPLGKAWGKLEEINSKLDTSIGKQNHIREQMRELEGVLAEGTPMSGLTSEDLYEGVSIFQEYQHVQEEIQKLTTRLEEEVSEYQSIEGEEQKSMAPLVDELEKTLAKMQQNFAVTDKEDEALESAMSKGEHRMVMFVSISGLAVISAIIGWALHRPLILGIMGGIALGGVVGAVFSYRKKEKMRNELNRLRLKTIEVKSKAKYMEEDIKRFKKKDEDAAIEKENRLAYHLRMKGIIERDNQELALLKRQERELLAELEPFQKNTVIESVQDIQRLAAKQRRIEDMRGEWEILARQEVQLSIEELKEERLKMLAQIEALEYEKGVYEGIDEYMDEVAKALQKKIAPSLNEAITQTVSQVTDGRYTRVFMTPDMEILLDGPTLPMPKSVEQLSRGTLDAIYISVRFALAKHLYGERQRPYIMDESFVHMDDERFERMMHRIDKEDSQRLLFTCHRREGEWLERQEEQKYKRRGEIIL